MRVGSQIIIMEICKAPTLRLKALNKHTHIMYIEMENVIPFFFNVYFDKCSSIIMQSIIFHKDQREKRFVSRRKRFVSL